MSLLPFEEAFDRLVGKAMAIQDMESLPLRAARDRVLGADLLALRTQPGFDASAMDGYAVRAEDLREPLTPLVQVGESAAGHGFAGPCANGQCVRIFTGAPMPSGADAVLIQENAVIQEDGAIMPKASVEPGQHVRAAGADFASGQILLAAGSVLTPARLALVASGGHPRLTVIRKPRVGIVATGDELVLPGEEVSPAQIVASNSFAVAAMIEEAGGSVIDYGIVRDDATAIGALVDRAAHEAVDVLVTIGGASVGDHDLVGPVFASRGVELDFWKIAMRPGKPLMAGRLGAMRVLGLPGNPASSLVTATLFLQPLVRALGGRPSTLPFRDGILGCDMKGNDSRADFLRASFDGSGALTPILTLAGRQDSSLLSVFAKADALLYRRPSAPADKAGEPCRFLPLN